MWGRGWSRRGSSPHIAASREQHDEHVRRALGRPERVDRRERGVGVLRVVGDKVSVRPVGDWQDLSLGFVLVILHLGGGFGHSDLPFLAFGYALGRSPGPSSYCAHPAVAFSSVGYRQEDEGNLVGPMRAGSPTRIASSRRLDHHEGGPVHGMPILEGHQVLSSCSEYLASP
jgi:hypothetical protein